MESKGLLGVLFDFSFSEFLTTRVIKFLYALFMVIITIYVLIIIGIAFSHGFMLGILALVISPILFLFMVILARLYLEFVIVVFRIFENTRDMAENTRPFAAPVPPIPPQTH